METDILIVGAGLAGCTLARSLAEKGRKVLVMEKHKHIGGHCYDYRNEHGITIHKYGPHIFHTTNREVWEFVKQFSDFYPFQHRVLSYINGGLVPFPINCDTINAIYNTNITVGEVEGFLEDQVAQSDYKEPPENFEDYVISKVGRTLYEAFFMNYTRKQWERHPRELSADVAKRIPVRTNRDPRYFSDPYQGIPVRGYTGLMESMLDHPNISILLGADFFQWQDSISRKALIYTGPLDAYFDYKHGELEYRSLRLEFETFDQENYQPAPVVNYPNDYEWTRITEFKQFLNEKSDKTTILKEYPSKEGEPYYVVYTKENLAVRDKYIKEVEALKEENIHFIGRLAEYKYYNMDAVILEALNRLDEIR